MGTKAGEIENDLVRAATALLRKQCGMLKEHCLLS